MGIKERLKAEPSATGKFFKTIVTYLLLIAAAVSEVGVLMGLMSDDWVPMWLRITLVVAAVVTRIGGNLTVKKDE